MMLTDLLIILNIILTKYTCALYLNEQLCEESNTRHTTSHLMSFLVK